MKNRRKKITTEALVDYFEGRLDPQAALALEQALATEPDLQVTLDWLRRYAPLLGEAAATSSSSRPRQPWHRCGSCSVIGSANCDRPPCLPLWPALCSIAGARWRRQALAEINTPTFRWSTARMPMMWTSGRRS